MNWCWKLPEVQTTSPFWEIVKKKCLLYVRVKADFSKLLWAGACQHSIDVAVLSGWADSVWIRGQVDRGGEAGRRSDRGPRGKPPPRPLGPRWRAQNTYGISDDLGKVSWFSMYLHQGFHMEREMKNEYPLAIPRWLISQRCYNSQSQKENQTKMMPKCLWFDQSQVNPYGIVESLYMCIGAVIKN